MLEKFSMTKKELIDKLNDVPKAKDDTPVGLGISVGDDFISASIIGVTYKMSNPRGLVISIGGEGNKS